MKKAFKASFTHPALDEMTPWEMFLFVERAAKLEGKKLDYIFISTGGGSRGILPIFNN